MTAIVGIGASAGGLEAITELLPELSSHPGAAIVIVQHLDRSHDSLLTEILRRKTPMPVESAVDGLAVKPDHVYVIPPNVTMTVAQGVLQLSPRAAGREIHKPVDSFFRSLAEDCGDAAVGVVLSGGDADGAAGVRAIKQAGGITFAQSPDTARVPSMPNSAIDTDCVDFVLPPSQIGQELARLAGHSYLKAAPSSDAGIPDDRDEPEGRAPDAVEEGESLRRVFRRLRTTHGVDFTRYKSTTLRRRLERRMALQKLDDLQDYVELLERDSSEAAALYQDFLIRVTSFFRDPESFRVLADKVFPSLIESRSHKEPIRIWVPGCATGEEVYSIAITLLEFMGESAPAAGVQIFGTDVSDEAIEKCRAGSYPESISEDVSAERLRRYFVKQDSHYTISRSIRDLCVFARHDITRDPPYSRLDLVSCRNLLIYLGATSQARVMQVFRYALRPRGFLLLGPSESVGQGEDVFEPVDKQHRLYRPRQSSSAAGLVLMERDGETHARGTSPSAQQAGPEFVEADVAQRHADRILLARYAPAGILVDPSLNILQFRGQTAPYLAPASGSPSLNFMRIARPELLVAIPPLLQEARSTSRPAIRTGIAMDGLGPVDVEVVPIAQPRGAECFLILLEDESSRRPPRRERRAPIEAMSDSEKDQRIAQVERENLELREFLQATMEQHEAAREELKSAHEEVLSANEEYQSTNEELETSKEELQSANEELTTTNEELRERNRLLAVLNIELDKARSTSERARVYADGIIETVREPLVVLDADLKILRVNKAFCTEFDIPPIQVEGKSLDIVSGALWSEPLNQQLMSVLAQGPVLSDFEVIIKHPRMGRRVLSLSGNRIPGDAERDELILLAIADVTENRRRTEALSEGSRRKDEFLAMLGHELRNPLGAITHAVHLLKLGGAGDSPKMHAMIERQTAHLVRLVNDLLDVARISRGHIELQRKLLDLAPIVRQGAEALRNKVEARRHVLSVSVPDSPVCVEGDSVRLEQVITNLLENAIKYTEAGGRISITVEEEGSEAVLRVSDSGIGIAADKIGHVFDLFAQVDPSLARSGGGLGLGLTVVRRVVELHGGSIEARSQGLGKGSEFCVRLPLASSALLQAPAVVSRGTLQPGEQRRILIVDDNSDSAEAMALVFRHWGHDVQFTGNAQSAVSLFDSFVPDVAFIDIGLPDIDGYELARRMRAKNGRQHVRLVAVTGYGTNADRARAREAGFDEHIVKPADAVKLAELLGNGAARPGN